MEACASQLERIRRERIAQVRRTESTAMRGFHARIDVINASGQHVRYADQAVAMALVASGAAVPVDGHGKVKAITLCESAQTTATRIGPPSPPKLGGVKFTRREHLDSGVSVWAHHPHCTYEP